MTTATGKSESISRLLTNCEVALTGTDDTCDSTIRAMGSAMQAQMKSQHIWTSVSSRSVTFRDGALGARGPSGTGMSRSMAASASPRVAAGDVRTSVSALESEMLIAQPLFRLGGPGTSE